MLISSENWLINRFYNYETNNCEQKSIAKRIALAVINLFLIPFRIAQTAYNKLIKSDSKIKTVNKKSLPIEGKESTKENNLTPQWIAMKLTASVAIGCFMPLLFLVGEKTSDFTGTCPSSLLPKGTTRFFSRNLHYPNILCTNSKIGCDYSWQIVKGPMFEEIVDRVLLQELLFKRMPKSIFMQFSPKLASIVDHVAIKAIRIFSSSVYFALHHSWGHTCREGDMYPYIFCGIVLGMLQEASGHPIYNAISHISSNWASDYWKTLF